MRRLRWILLAVVVLGAGGGYAYWSHASSHPGTADAYVQAHVVRIAAQLSGPVLKLNIRNRQHVAKGDLLFEIDPAPYQAALDAAQAQLDLARQEQAVLVAQAQAAQAQLNERRARLEDARQHAQRVHALFKKGLASKQQDDDTKATLKSARAAFDAAESELRRAQAALGETGEGNAQVRLAKARVEQARLDVQHTRVSAPAAGIVANLTLRVGTMVEPGQALFALVESNDWWVDANYKETDLARIQPGQPARIRVDMYPDKIFEGVVRVINPASGAAFALLPPENATGNWVKVTQRFPVEIRLLHPDPHYPLRVGASAQVSIDTRAAHEPPATPGTP